MERVSVADVEGMRCFVGCRRCRSALGAARDEDRSIHTGSSAEHSTGRLGRMIREIAVPLCSGIPIFFNLNPAS